MLIDFRLRIVTLLLRTRVNVFVWKEVYQELEKSVQLRVKILLIILIPSFLKLRLLYLAKGVQLRQDVKLIGILVQEHLRVEETELAQLLR